MLDTVLLLAIVAFLKEWLGLSGKLVIGGAILVVGSLLWFQADITAIYPIFGSVIEYLKFILAAPGVFDLVTNVGTKIGKAVNG